MNPESRAGMAGGRRGTVRAVVATALLPLLSSWAVATTFSDLDDGTDARNLRAGPYDGRGTRPVDSYRLLGAVDDGFCADVLAALNQPGQFAGDDFLRWWLDVPGLVAFTPLAGHGSIPEFPAAPDAVEVAIVDLDGDGNREYVYRAPRKAGDRYSQQLVIYDHDVREDSAAARRARTVCTSPGCEADDSGVDVVVLHPRPQDRGNVRWASDSESMLRAAHPEQAARQAIMPTAGNASWFVLDLGHGAALLAVPSDVTGRKPFAIGVFRPSRTTADALQCVIVPDFWWQPPVPHIIRREYIVVPVLPAVPPRPSRPPKPPKPPKPEKPEKPEKQHKPHRPHVPHEPTAPQKKE